MVPADVLPAGLQRIAQLLPGTHAMNLFRALAMGEATAVSPWWSLVVLTAGGFAAFGIAILLFSWDNRNTDRQSPLLAMLALLPYVFSVIFLP